MIQKIDKEAIFEKVLNTTVTENLSVKDAQELLQKTINNTYLDKLNELIDYVNTNEPLKATIIISKSI